MPRAVRPNVLSLLLFTAAAIRTAACGSAASTTPTTPAPAATTQSFSESVGQQGSVVHSFTVSAMGPVEIELTSVAPLATMALGVGIGTWNGTSCGSTIVQNDNARSGVVALKGTAAAGNYCLRVYDSGNIPEAATVTYTVQVVHP